LGTNICSGDSKILARKIMEILSLPREKISLIRHHARKKIVETFNFMDSTRVMIEIIESKHNSKGLLIKY
ncbi:unnamed protein product, partial [marine sediment metagenome]